MGRTNVKGKEKEAKEKPVPYVKRTRGRPKKETSDASCKEEEEELTLVEECETKAAKKDGVTAMTELKGKRPSKEESAPSAKRLRGRPKKEDINGVVSATVKEEVEEEEIKPRGKKNKRNEGKESPILKPVRGRPKREAASKVAPATMKEEEEEEEEVEEEETKPKKKSKATKKPSSAKNGKKSKEIPKEKIGVERAVLKKGLAAVDGVCPIARSSHVYCEGDDIWDCMLNQTNIQFNNNKYYIIQLLKDDHKEAYSVWMRWGRVGATGQNSLKPCAGNLSQAKNTFTKKFSDKTRNDWNSRDCFSKVSGKYDLLKMDYSDAPDDVDSKEKKPEEKPPKKKVESCLEVRVKALVELICDVRAMEEAVVEMKYDAKKAPLGKLTSDQVKAGYAALKDIESIILASEKASNRDLLEACNAFYTRIPHCFGMKVPPLIRTNAEIREKLSLLQTLSDIQAAMVVMSQPRDENLHPVDQHYRDLYCDIASLDKGDLEFELVNKYLRTTHGKTHTLYKMDLLEVFRVTRSAESGRFKDVGNRMLLWHGSRLTNWAGILNQGLRIAPPEAPSTGYMFGKGVYFADMVSKSANYCMPSYQNKTGLLVLCDVALGKCNELLDADYEAHKLPKGFQSVKGLGKIAPQSKNYSTSNDGATIPMGPAADTKVKNNAGYVLQYNEYIVYDVAQVKIKYLLKVQFNFD